MTIVHDETEFLRELAYTGAAWAEANYRLARLTAGLDARPEVQTPAETRNLNRQGWLRARANAEQRMDEMIKHWISWAPDREMDTPDDPLVGER